MANNTLAENLIRLQEAKEDIADAIVEMGGTASSTDGLEDMPDAIRTIQANPTLITKSITENGIYDAENDNADGYSEVTVAVPQPIAFILVTTDSGVTITVSKGSTVLPTQTSSGEELVFEITEQGTWTVSGSNGITKTVSVGSDRVYYVKIAASIYGVEWDETSSTAFTRTDDAANFSEPNPYYAGMSGEPSSPFDNLMPWSGMVKETIDGNVMVKIPKFWYKITNDTNSLKIQISDAPHTGFFVSPAHADRDDGQGERDYVYVGRYKCSSTDYKSQTGKLPKASITRATARTSIHNLGSNYWQFDYAMYWTICFLYIVEFANWNSQKAIGYGCTAGNTASSGTVTATGYMDSIPYHTGTDQSARTNYGGTQYRYIEGLWDNGFDWCDGIYFYNGGIYCNKKPSTYNDTSNGIYIGARANAGLITSFWTLGVAGYEWALYPIQTSGIGGTDNNAYDTYISDYKAAIQSNKYCVLSIGAYNYETRAYGLFSFNDYDSYDTSWTAITCRLMYLPPNSNS